MKINMAFNENDLLQLSHSRFSFMDCLINHSEWQAENTSMSSDWLRKVFDLRVSSFFLIKFKGVMILSIKKTLY